MPITPSNLLTLHEIYTRTELWKDKIYHISHNPYWNNNWDFLPLPKKFSEILTEFKEEVKKQKLAERPEEARNEAQQRINEIFQEIKEIIQEEIDQEEASGIEFEPGTQPTEEEQKELEEWEKNKQERIKNLKLALKKTTLSQFQKINDENLQNEELTTLLTEWKENREILLDRKNICFVLEDNQESFKFCYQPPHGNFSALTNFLWYKNNIWYETIFWERINHENAIITAKRSFFIYRYPRFFSKGANGIIHNSPKFGNKDEICQCPAFLESTEYIEFTSDWQPEYQLFKLDNFQGMSKGTISNVKGEYPVFHTLQVSPVNLDDWVSRDIQPTSFFLLPSFYNRGIFSMKEFGSKFFTNKNKDSKISLVDWVKIAKMERMDHQGKGGEYEHLLKHVNVNYFWGSKKIHESNLDEMDLSNFKVVVRANPAGIMYRFESKKVFFRYSEDLNFTLDADQIEKASRNFLVKGASGLLKFATAGIVDGEETLKQEAGLGETTKNYLHSGKTDKGKDERQGERKKTLAASTSNIMQSVMGSIPSILDASHTHGNYSLAELALRFESMQFWIRLEFNKNLCYRYQQMKSMLKKNGNEVFNTQKFGNILQKGYWKIVSNIFEGDKDGFFAGIFSKGVYLYENHPHEYFLAKGEKGEFIRGILNKDPVGTNTTIQVNYNSSIGRDDQVHVDDMSWVWKDSYCRGAGKDLFPQLIEQGRAYIKKDEGTPSQKAYYKYQITSKEGQKTPDWSTKKYYTKEEWDKITPDTQNGKNLKNWEYDYSRLEYIQEKNSPHYVNKQTKKTPTEADMLWYTYDMKNAEGVNMHGVFQGSNESEYNSLPKSHSGLKVGDWWAGYYMTGAGAWKFDGYAKWSGNAKLEPNVQYEWYMHAFSSGQKDGRAFRGLDDGVEVILRQDGADWELAFKGRVEITETLGNPDAIGSGVEIDEMEEILPDLEDEKQTDGLDNLDKTMEPEPEQQNQNDKEIQEEIEQQAEPEQQKQDEKQDELEQEDEKNKEKQQQKQKEKQQEQEDEQQQPENSREGEK